LIKLLRFIALAGRTWLPDRMLYNGADAPALVHSLAAAPPVTDVTTTASDGPV